MPEVGVKIRATMRINGSKELHASPQDALFDDICNEVGSDTTYISSLSKIVLVDSGGTERDYTTTLSFSQPAENQLKVECSISITASYTVSYVRAYAGTKKYFETSWSKSVSSGDVVNITLTITVSTSGSLSGSTTGSITVNNMSSNIAKALGGITRDQIGLKTVKVLSTQVTEMLSATFTRTIDLPNNRVTGDTGTVSPSSAGYAKYMVYQNSAGTGILGWTFDTTVDIPSIATTRLKITYTFTVS